VILLDTSGLLAALDASQPSHGAAAEALAAAGPPRLLSPFVLAELDYLLRSRVGDEAQRALLSEVARGAYRLEAFSRGDVDVARAVMERWKGLALDLADASIVVLSHRHDARDVLTLDEHRFRRLRRAGGRAFRVLPADHGSIA
jgi:predicted nucleic acid-binding protein